MAHELEQHGDQVAFVDTRTDAWHRLNNLPADMIGKDLTAEDALRLAHLAGWDIHKRPTFVNLGTDEDPHYVEVPNDHASIRTNPWTGELEPLGGGLGGQWTPFQNESLVAFLNALVHESKGRIETAGSIKGGRQVFVSTKLPETMTVGGVDRVDLYVIARTRHDGTGATDFLASPVRPVCANTIRAAVLSAVSSMSVRHTTGQDRYVELAREKLGLAVKSFGDLEAEFERMIQVDQTEAEFRKIIDATFYPDGKVPTEKGRGLTIKTNRDDVLMSLWADADTQRDIRGTRYAGYQAVVEYLDHFAPVQGADGDEDKARDLRAQRVLTGTDLDVRNRVFDLSRVTA